MRPGSSDHERKVLRLWIESSATYAGTYACLGCGVYERAAARARCCRARCVGCHKKQRQGASPGSCTDTRWRALCNLDRPREVAAAAGTAGQERRRAGALRPGGLREHGRLRTTSSCWPRSARAASNWPKSKRFDMPGFRPNRYYLREMQRFGFLPRGPEAGRSRRLLRRRTGLLEIVHLPAARVGEARRGGVRQPAETPGYFRNSLIANSSPRTTW